MKYLHKFLEFISFIIERLCTLLLIIMCLSIFVQVLNRAFFKGAFFWSEPVAILCVIWTTLLGSVVASHYGSHTRVDFFLRKLPYSIRRFVECFNCLVCSVFLVILTRYSLPVIESTKIYKVHGLELFNKSIYYWPILLGSALMVVYYIFKAVQYLISEAPKDELPTE